MTTYINAYINFGGRAREALEFYRSVFGGELSLGTLGEAGMATDPADADKLMHGQLHTDFGMRVMASDMMADDTPPADGRGAGPVVHLSVNGEDDSIDAYWAALSDGAQVVEPYAQAPWGDYFGTLTDRFGITWLVNRSLPQG